MENVISLLNQLLNCWYLDIKFLDELIEKYNIDLDIQDIISNYWYSNIKDLNINIFIYQAFEDIKNNFINDNKDEIELLWININDVEYEIYTNYFDSHLWFNDNEIDELFQKWKK